MATKKVGKLQIELEALTQQFSHQIAKAKNTNDKLAKSFKRSKSAAGAMTAQLKSLGMMLASGFGARALVNFGREAIQMGDDLAKASRRIGFSVESLQALQFEAKAGGFEVEQLHKALTKFSTGIGEVATLGTGEFKGTLEKLGINLRDNAGNIREIDDLLVEFAQKSMAAATSIERLTYVGEAFGLRGTKMIQILPLIAQGMDAVKASSLDFGAIVKDEELLALEQAQDAIDRLSTTWDAFAMRTVGGFAIGAGFGDDVSFAARQLALLNAQMESMAVAPGVGRQTPMAGSGVTFDEQMRATERILEEAKAIQQRRKELESLDLGGVSRTDPTSIAAIPLLAQPDFSPVDTADQKGQPLPEWMQKGFWGDLARERNRAAFDQFGDFGLGAEVERAAQELEARREFTLDLTTQASVSFGSLRDEADDNRTAFERMAESMNDSIRTQTDGAKQMEAAIFSVSTAIENQLVNAIMTGKFSFQDFGRSVMATMAQIITRMMVMKAITATLGLFSGGGTEVSRPDFSTVSGMGSGNFADLPSTAPSFMKPAVASSAGPGPVSVTVNNAAPHSEEESQKIGAIVSRAVREAWRTQALNESRPGGLFNPVA
jgi:hypothetical protein